MPIVRVAKRFMLRMNEDDRPVEYLPGRYEVSDEVADHWYFKAHLEGYVAPEPPDGTVQYAQRKLIAEQAVRMSGSEEAQLQPPAPLPPNVERAAPAPNYFAGGGPIEDKPMPDPVAFMGTQSPS